MADTLAA